MSFTFGTGSSNTNSGGGGGPSSSNSTGGGFAFGSTTSTSSAPNVSASTSTPSFAFNIGDSSAQQPAALATSDATKATPPAFGGFSFGANTAATTTTTATFPAVATTTTTNTASLFFNSNPAAANANNHTTNDKPAFFGAPVTIAPPTTTTANNNDSTTTGGDIKPAVSFGGAPTASSSQLGGGGGGGAFSFGNTFGTTTNAATSTNSTALNTAAATPAVSFGAGNFGGGTGTTTNDIKTASTSAGGFNFGSAPSANSSATTSGIGANETSATEGAAGVHATTPVPTFGSTNPATTPVPPSTSTGTGFAFGTSTPTPLTPLPAATPGPPDPVATPGVPTPAKTTTAPASTTQEPIRLEYQTLTVEQILNMFQQEIEKDAIVYLEEARRVAEYDAILRDSQRDLNMLTENVHRCLIEQKEVEQTLIGIGAFQSELDRNLDAVERNVDELFGSQSHLVPADADQERETAYKMAHDVDVRLQELHTTIQNTMQQMESAEERALTGDVAKIVKVLNQHQRSLANLEDVARRLEVDIAQVNRVLTQR